MRDHLVFEIFTILIFLILNKCRLTTSKRLSFILPSEEAHKLTENEEDASLKETWAMPLKLHVRSYIIRTDVKYRFAVTTVSSTVVNPADIDQQVNFTVTIPESAFISRFLLTVNGTTYTSRVTGRYEAKKQYDRAEQTGQTTGHVRISDEDSNRFIISVSVQANTVVGFNLTYEQFLRRASGFYEVQTIMTPGLMIDNFDIIVNIEESAPLTKLAAFSSTGAQGIKEFKLLDNSTIHRSGDRTAHIRWGSNLTEGPKATDQDEMKRLLVIRYDVDRTNLSNQILVGKSHFAHFIAPGNLKTLPKYSIFLIDVSSSMVGSKLSRVKEALTGILTEIHQDDYFSLLLFSRIIELWSPNGGTVELIDELSESESGYIIRGTRKNVQEAIEFLNNVQVFSHTNIIDALRAGINLAIVNRQLRPEHRPIMVFITDGDPTFEERNNNVIIKNITQLNRNVNCAIYSLAIGKDAKIKFLDDLSKSNDGYAKTVLIDDDSSNRLTDFYKEISSPLMSNVSLKYDSKLVNESSISRTNFMNYFDGSELVIAGKVTEDNLRHRKIDVRLKANYKLFNGRDHIRNIQKLVINQNISSGTDHLERIWAFMRLKELLDQAKISGTVNSSIKKEILNLSMTYSFVTPLTSLVVVKPNGTIYLKISTENDENEHQSRRITTEKSISTGIDNYKVATVTLSLSESEILTTSEENNPPKNPTPLVSPNAFKLAAAHIHTLLPSSTVTATTTNSHEFFPSR